METFTTLSTDNRLIELKENGENITVTYATRIEFTDMVEEYRMHEFDEQVEYIRRGLSKVLPLNYLTLFTWREMETMICGTPQFNVDLLQECTEYSSCSPQDQHVIWFWECLRLYSDDECSAFLRFVWGRSRLPTSAGDFSQLFKIQAFSRSPADTYLPVSHTCFFSLELPRYSSLKILSERLLYAIYNCQAIDGDGDAVQANQLGWEE